MRKKDLYPLFDPWASGMLPLDNRHVMYWEQCGFRDGVPVLFLHGGPGAGASPNHRRFFDPSFYRVVIFDQRGCGRSRPVGELRDNDTDSLLQDIETLRRHLGIERWIVFGGSWGSTLALAYAQACPDRTLALVLRGIFLGGDDEIDWFMHGIRTVFPEIWREFVGFLPESERSDLLDSYYRRLIDPDPRIHMPAARMWSRYEACCSTLYPNPSAWSDMGDDPGALSISRIEAHYFVKKLFLQPGQILKNIDLIREIPATIVQGRYDIICPMATADRLHRAWPEAEMVIVPDAGHAAMEPGIRTALVGAMENLKLSVGRRPARQFPKHAGTEQKQG